MASFGPSFSLPFMAQARGRAGHENKEGKSEDPITCCTDRENEANKMFSICFVDYSGFERGD